MQDFIARQYARPEGVLGRLLFGPLLNRANARANRFVQELLQLAPDDDVLEVGFGGGELLFRMARQLPDGQVTGIELSEPMRRRAERRAGRFSNVTLSAGSVDALPFSPDTFNRIVSVNTIYFWPDLQAGMYELARVCRPGGLLVLGFASDADMRAAGWEQRGFTLRSPEQISAGVLEAGFGIDDLFSFSQPRGQYFGLRAIYQGLET